MLRRLFAPLLAGVALALAGQAHAQSPRPLPATTPVRFESWRPAGYYADSSPPNVRLVPAARNRTRQALIGGAIGAGVGVVFCTAVSTLVDDSAEGGVSFCPWDSYLLIGGAGAVLGAAVGWVI
jgi:hypothetical protein